MDNCFVVMPFREPFDTYYIEIYVPAIKKACLEPKRGDSLFRAGSIMSDIWLMIQDAKLLVAELTGANPNVFYELGLAHALGKPVVLVSETLDDVPFDLRSERVIRYDKNNPSWGSILSDCIGRAIAGTLENPVSAVPTMFRRVVESQAPEQTREEQRLATIEQRIDALVASLEKNPAIFDVAAEVPVQQLLDDLVRGVQIGGSQRSVRVAEQALRKGAPPLKVLTALQKLMTPTAAKEVIEEAMKHILSKS